LREPSGEQHDGGGVEEGSGGFEGCLEVLGEAAVAADPGEEALDDPAPGLDGEADLVGVLANDLDGDGGGAGNPLPGVAAVGKDLREAASTGPPPSRSWMSAG
jgi:hypothetical protein